MILTHLVFFEFFPGASDTAAPGSMGGSLSVPPYYLFDGFSDSGFVPPEPPTPEPEVRVSGVKKRVRRVRRADFSSQANYEFALRQALLDADFGIREFDEPKPVEAKKTTRFVVNDTAIKISDEEFAALQEARKRGKIAMIKLFISIIEDE